jgi:hypothetical protein
MGQKLFYEPSVFSYFSPLYRIPGGQLAPEFQLYSTQAAAERADIINAALYGIWTKALPSISRPSRASAPTSAAC